MIKYSKGKKFTPNVSRSISKAIRPFRARQDRQGQSIASLRLRLIALEAMVATLRENQENQE